MLRSCDANLASKMMKEIFGDGFDYFKIRERRRELVKQAKALLEDAKVSMRNERRDAMDAIKEMKKENLLTEDTQKNAEKEVQKILDNATKEVDDMFSAKEKEIMSV